MHTPEVAPDDFLPRLVHVVHTRGTYLLIQAFDICNGRILTTKKPDMSWSAIKCLVRVSLDSRTLHS
jgi:hypothetical protein